MHRSSMLLAGFVWSDFLSTLDFSKPFHVRFISSSKKVMPSLRLKGRGSAASVRQAVRAKVVLL